MLSQRTKSSLRIALGCAKSGTLARKRSAAILRVMSGWAPRLIGVLTLTACGESTVEPPEGAGSVGPVLFVDEVPANTCLPRALNASADGSTPCTMVEVRVVDAGGRCGACEAGTGRGPATAHVARAVEDWLESREFCGPTTGRNCSAPSTAAAGHCQCELRQLSGDDGAACRSEPAPAVSGWCYVHPDRGLGDPALVASCTQRSPGMLRVVGSALPTGNARLLIACPSQHLR
jgi:hypothetical protein